MPSWLGGSRPGSSMYMCEKRKGASLDLSTPLQYQVIRQTQGSVTFLRLSLGCLLPEQASSSPNRSSTDDLGSLVLRDQPVSFA